MRKINPAGLAIMKVGEGCRLAAYQDQRGIWTIGWGHTPARQGQTCSQAAADAWFVQDSAWAAAAVDADTSGFASDNQFSAMASLAFNIGVGAFRSSSVLRLHVARDYAAAADAFLLWDKEHVNGRLVVSDGLLGRRERERQLYLLA